MQKPHQDHSAHAHPVLITEDLSEYLEICNCTVCGNKEQEIIYEATRKEFNEDDLRKEFSSSGGLPLNDQLVRCTQCGLIYVSPRLKSDVMVASYAKGDDERFVSQNPSRIRNFEKHLRKIEKDGLLGEDLSVFDIGTGGAAFLKTCLDRGYKVSGVEPNAWLCNWAKQEYDIDVMPGTLQDALPSEKKYDLVTIWDVLEHVPDPRVVIQQVSSIIKNDGIFILTFPDIGRWLPRLLGRKWSYLSTVHLWYFTRELISRVLADYNFEVVKHYSYANRLRLGYVFERAKETVSAFGFLESLAKFLRISNIEISYHLGQTLVVSKYRA